VDVGALDSEVAPGYDNSTGFGRVDAPLAASLLEFTEPLALGATQAAAAPLALAQPAQIEEAFDFLDALQALGIEVQTILSDLDLADLLQGRLPAVDDLIRLRYESDPEDAPVRADFGFGFDGIGSLHDTDLAGLLRAEAQPQFALELGLDLGGFYVGAGTSLNAQITATGEARGSFASLDAAAIGQLSLTARLPMAPLDAPANGGDGDGKVRLAEFQQNFTSLGVEVPDVAADLTVELEIGVLDYVDADGDATNNSPFGGDAFRFVASTALGLDGDGAVTWSGIDIRNPDVNGDGTEDFTSAVLAEDLRLLARDVVRGNRSIFSQDLLAALNLDDLPLSGTPLGDALDVGAKLADLILSNLEVLHVMEFGPLEPGAFVNGDTIEEWLNFGLPPTTQEIIRLGLNVDIPLTPLSSLSFDLSSVLPDFVDPAGERASRMPGCLATWCSASTRTPTRST
jgi:hypothetical protein